MYQACKTHMRVGSGDPHDQRYIVGQSKKTIERVSVLRRQTHLTRALLRLALAVERTFWS